MAANSLRLRPIVRKSLLAGLLIGIFAGGIGAAPIAGPTPAAVTPLKSPSSAPTTLGKTVTGRLLDMQNGFAFFSSGDSFRLAPGASVTDLATGKPFAGDNVTGYYAQTTFAPNGTIVALKLSRRALKLDDLSEVKTYAVALSTPYSNPDFGNTEGFTGAPVLVSFTVEVPPTTPFSDNVYISTEASRWDPMEIRMDRVDSLHYRITRRIASGTRLVYRYTRGTWKAAERGRTGMEDPPRNFLIRNLDAARRDDVVAHWSDESADGSQVISPDAIPTPFSNNPFSVPSPGTHF